MTRITFIHRYRKFRLSEITNPLKCIVFMPVDDNAAIIFTVTLLIALFLDLIKSCKS